MAKETNEKAPVCSGGVNLHFNFPDGSFFAACSNTARCVIARENRKGQYCIGIPGINIDERGKEDGEMMMKKHAPKKQSFREKMDEFSDALLLTLHADLFESAPRFCAPEHIRPFLLIENIERKRCDGCFSSLSLSFSPLLDESNLLHLNPGGSRFPIGTVPLVVFVARRLIYG